jgi:hypothetical protein
VKFDPTKYGALAWGVISFGLGLAIEQHKVRELVLKSFDFLTHLLARYASYERLFRTEIDIKLSKDLSGLEKSLVDVYKAVLIYGGEVNQYLKELGIGMKIYFPFYALIK